MAVSERRAERLTLVAMSLGFAVVQLDISVVNVAIKAIGDALGGGVSALQWVVNAYTIGFAAFILTAGALADRIGAKGVFVAGFALFTTASVVCGLAPDLGVLIAARAVQGIGAAVLVPSSLTLLNHAYTDAAARAHAVGLWLAGASLALSGGPLVGGVLIATLGWRAIFFINVPVALIGIWLSRRFAGETPQARDRGVDVAGQAFAVLTLTALVAATIEGGTQGFGSLPVLVGYALAALAGVIFVALEARGARPMLPLALFRARAFSAPAAIGILINTAFYGLIFVFSLLFQRAQHLTALQTGLALAPIMVAITAANVAAGRVNRLVGPRRTVAAGVVAFAACCAGLLGVGARTGYAAMVVQLTLLGAAAGSIVPVITSEMLGSVDRSRSGVAAGTLNTLRQTGSAIGVALFGSLLAGSGITVGVHISLGITIGLSAVILTLTPLMAARPGAGAEPAPPSRASG
ncbi:MAG: MFS transporter [Solirubrobacterales bacterium]|nr:MFS transporter [Solirubrobacterales bacterium]